MPQDDLEDIDDRIEERSPPRKIKRKLATPEATRMNEPWEEDK